MLTRGMQDVYNPLLFGLNPSLSLALCLSVREQNPHILTHPLFCPIQAGEAMICHTQSFTSQLHKHLSSQETSLNTRMSQISLMDWFHCHENQEHSLQSSWTIHLNWTDWMSVVFSISTDWWILFYFFPFPWAQDYLNKK